MGEQREVLFREEQRMRVWWIWLVLLIAFAGSAVASAGAWTEAMHVPLVVPAIWIPILWLLWFARLETEVSRDGLYVRLWPLHLSRRRTGLEGVERVRAVRYRPILQYGGWGIRWAFWSKGRAYNMSGDRGVRVDYAYGHHMLIGSQQAEELAAAIEEVRDQG